MRLDIPPEIEAAQLDEYRQVFEAGDRSALLRAIRFCFEQQIVAPEWIVVAWANTTNKWYAMEVKELGEALGVAWPKGKKKGKGGKSFAAMRKQRLLKSGVWNAVRDARKRGRAIDDELFEEIGETLNVGGRTLVKTYYRSARSFVMPIAAKMLLDTLRRKK